MLGAASKSSGGSCSTRSDRDSEARFNSEVERRKARIGDSAEGEGERG
jgi:hypothetical protein